MTMCRVMTVMLLACGVLLAGCGSPPKSGSTAQSRNDRAPLPDPVDVVTAYNQRVRDLERLRSPVTLVLDAPDDKGGRDREQVDGLLQVALPSRVALRIDKVGQTVYYLGSNDHHYWWFNLGKQREAYVGTHALATPLKARRFGLPVHPLDLVEVAGVTPLPAPSLLSLAWRDGLLEVSVPGRWGSRRLMLDGVTYEPRRIEIVERDGTVAVSSMLDRYVSVPVDGQAFTSARVASRIDVEVPRAEARVSIALTEPFNPREKLRMKAFDLVALMDGYAFKDAIDIDVEAPPVAAGAP